MIQNLILLVGYATNLFSILVLARVVLSWVTTDPNNALVGLVYRLTEPVMRPVRNLLPPMSGMDFSPILVLFGIQILERVVIRILIGMA